MATLVDTYEQQYAVLTADITGKIGQLSSASSDRKPMIAELDRQLEEAHELLEQMELEVREVEVSQRPRLRTRVDSYQAELRRLKQDFQSACSTSYIEGFGDGTEELFINDDLSMKEEQRQRLLNNSERLERTGNQLLAGYRTVIETEEVGNQVLQDLAIQRETIQRARSRLRETDADLGRSSRLMSGMMFRSLQQRFVLIGVSVVIGVVIIWFIYYAFARTS
ncbi:vesicle transport through interaction with t-SNAREs homolog 1A isoform X2 [Frankliniella occidentalis]|uniref:Vesicle transport through interaction with t-SNAREs homolog 1A n=1 Tax=Frankliniella occidentalis TaxID=133901 RepID=A0A6J1S3N3_FRAOC|nr:vesicle transport through interaction with t-SNAREs homolog 1A isoform X2 [Frankliniella occidentalis]